MALSQDELVLTRIKNAVIQHDEDELVKAIQDSLEMGIDPQKAIFEGLVPGMEKAGELYDDNVYYIPELLMCTEVLYMGMEMLKAKLPKDGWGTGGTVIIGVVEGDIHDIGKNIVKTMLEISGFKVHDLGRDVPLQKFLAEHEKLQPDMVCLSTMMTTTMMEIKEIISEIKKHRDSKVVILVGGAPVTAEIARQWGADARAENAYTARKAAIETISQLRASLKKGTLKKVLSKDVADRQGHDKN